MKELKSHTSKYDLKRTSAFFGPYRATTRAERWANFVIIALGLVGLGIILGTL